ncbi:MAG: threonine-phosphate decarboxylase [Hyphomicrobiales bacterium]
MNPGSIPGEASNISQDQTFAKAQRNGPTNMKHGGEPPYKNHLDKDRWLDLSTGINPIPYSLPTLTATDWQALPLKRDMDELLSSARIAYEIPNDIEIFAGPGTEALIWQLPDMFDGATSVLGPTYSSHAESWAHWNGSPSILASNCSWPTNQNLVVVNPNNPTGAFIAPETLIEFARTLAPGCVLVVDEAFMDCTPEFSVIRHLEPNLPILVLRSFGKFYGQAGLRLGFAIGQKSRIRQLSMRIGDWSVSGPALQIGKRALLDQNWQYTMRLHLKSRMNQLVGFLKRPNSIVGKTDLFLLYNHLEAHDLHEFLAQQRIWTRIFSDNPSWIRFGVPGNIKDFSRLVQGFYDFYETKQET